MSWSISTKPVPFEEVADAIDVLENPYGVTVNTASETQEQIDAAKAAAKTLVASGALGTAGFYLVRLSGHAEPSHAAPSGPYSSVESVSISVQQYYMEPNHE